MNFSLLTPVQIGSAIEKLRYVIFQHSERRVHVLEYSDDCIMLLDREFGSLESADRVEGPDGREKINTFLISILQQQK